MGSSPVPAASADAAVTGVTAEAVELNLGLSIGGTAAEGATSPASSPPAEAMLSTGEMSEQQWRREYNAFRRRELRRKQEEKLMRKAAGAARQKTHEKVHKDGTAAAADSRSDDSGGSPAVFSPAPISVRHTKTNSSVNEPPPATVGYAAAAAIPVMPMPCYSPMHYVAPYAGSPYGFPCVVPYWAAPVVPQAEAAAVEVETRIMPAVAAVGVPVVTGKEAVVDERSSSEMSDFLDLSFKDVPGVSKSSSSGTKSESSLTVATGDHPKPAQQQDTIPYHILPSPKNCKKNACTIKHHLLEELEGASSVTQKTPDPNCSINKRQKSDEYMEEKRDEKEEKMPCVAARGDGPEGKIITGFLYRYTEGEVSIMCVCHGRSFSPAEFLRHAGNSETSQPLRHIVVVPPHRQETS